MASTATISKTSGVLFISVDGLPARSYFGATGNYQFSTDTTYVTIQINQNNRPSLEFQIPWTGLTVGSQTPLTLTTARVLLNAVFGS